MSFLILAGWLVYNLSQCDGLDPADDFPTPAQVKEREADEEIEKLKQSGTDVQKDFANGVFKAGDPVEKLLEKHRPTIHLRHAAYSTIWYLHDHKDSLKRCPLFEVIACDGRLCFAGIYRQVTLGLVYDISFFGGPPSALVFTTDYVKTLTAAMDWYQATARDVAMAVTGSVLGGLSEITLCEKATGTSTP